MDLSVGEAFEVLGGLYCGIFRILARDSEGLILGIIQASPDLIKKRGRKSKLIGEKNSAPLRNTTQTIFLSNDDFKNLVDQELVDHWELEITNDLKQYGEMCQEEWNNRIEVMNLFLDAVSLEDALLSTGKFTTLINKTARKTKISSKVIGKYLNLLILYGFVKEALIPQHQKKGGPNKQRSNLSNIRKNGRKSLTYISALINNQPLPKEGRAMNMEFIEKIHNYLVKAPIPHPSMRSMWLETLEDQFLVTTKDENGKELTSFVTEYEYPTWRQFHYYVSKHYDKHGRQQFRTTPKNRQLNRRALLGKNHWGVAGPGHTYTIDSTIADIYLVHHSHREKIIGRPIVYVVVDVWSGAVVGFYVCLSGPDWESEKIALFCSAFDPEKMAKIRGLKYKPTFKHKPKLPKILLSDRGESLSKAARKTSFKIHMDQSIAAMCRGDWKSNVEVKFRTIKDETLLFVPGTFDARREEKELNQSNPKVAAMSLQDFTEYLYSFFHAFNNRVVSRDRIPQGMELEGILPTRAAIWDWGHEMHLSGGIHTTEDRLIEELLPKYKATTQRGGIRLSIKPARYYGDIDNERDIRICEDAGGGLSMDIDAWVYPGCIDWIWTNDGCVSGLRQIPLAGKNLQHLTEQEFEDIQFMISVTSSKHTHSQTELAVLEKHDQKLIIDQAKAATKAALRNNPRKAKQNIQENRKDEINYRAPKNEVSKVKVSTFESSVSSNSGHMSPDDFIKQFLLGGQK